MQINEECAYFAITLTPPWYHLYLWTNFVVSSCSTTHSHSFQKSDNMFAIHYMHAFGNNRKYTTIRSVYRRLSQSLSLSLTLFCLCRQLTRLSRITNTYNSISVSTWPWPLPLFRFARLSSRQFAHPHKVDCGGTRPAGLLAIHILVIVFENSISSQVGYLLRWWANFPRCGSHIDILNGFV